MMRGGLYLLLSHYTVPYDQVQIALTWLPDVLCGELSLGLIESKVVLN